MGAAFTLLGELFPVQIVRLFMKATPEAESAAPAFIRIYFISFLFLGYLVVSIYYLQSVMQRTASSVIAVCRAFVFPAVFLLILPYFMKLTGVYAAVTAAEILLFLCSASWQIKEKKHR